VRESSLRIIICGNGLHEREVKGIESLSSLPAHWFAYTNLDLATAPGSSREIDVIIIADDRILIVDLKDWFGPIESREGHWFNAGRDHGSSPVAKISANARHVSIQLEAHLKRYSKDAKPIVPKVQGLVVLTKVTDLSEISETERQGVMPIAHFTSSLKTVATRINVFGKAPPTGLLTSPEWKDQLSKFFNVSKGVFAPGRRTYGGFYATSAAPVFEHPDKVYAEFEASDERHSPTLGVLRLWDFSKTETRFQTEEGRSEIAGREQEVIAYLQDRCEHCDSVIINGKTRDPNFGVRYWEVYDRRRRLNRLTDFVNIELVDLSREDRIELARQLLTSLDALHLSEAAHLDIGPHSVWVQRPSTVRLSHLMAASYPSVRSLGTSRFQFLSSGKLPEDIFEEETTAKRRDVFLAACEVHRILLGKGPATSSGITEWDSSADVGSDYVELHRWLESGLALNPMDRFKDAGEALKAFNSAVAIRPTPAEVIEGLERHRGAIKSQMALFQAYPPAEILRDDDSRSMWRTNKDGIEVLVKVWKRASWGDQNREGPRILDFLDQVAEIAAIEPAGCAKILGAVWLGDAIVLLQEWIDRPDLAQVMEQRPEQLGEDARLQLIDALARRVEELHALRLAHGDLKPANILVDPEAPDDPIIVDLYDFTSISDGETVTTRYCPEIGGRYERDCFGVTAIAEELLIGSESPISGRVRDAILQVRTSEPANGTLLPLIDVRAAEELALAESETIHVAGPHVVPGAFLSDEGRYFLRRAPWGRSLMIRGACEELEVGINNEGKAYRLSRRTIEQSKIKSLQRFEFGSISAVIVVEDAAITRLGELTPILERDDVMNAFAEAPDLATIAEDQETAEESEIVAREPATDDLIEAIMAEPLPNGQVDVAKLWEFLVETERELVTYGQVTEDSFFDRSVKLHKVQFELLNGSFDYDRRDRVMIEREDRNGNWRPVGQLDLQRSKPDNLYLLSFRPEQRNATPLVNAGDELRFRSRMEETSLDRRQTAVRRIVGRNSRTRNLIGIFDPRIASSPMVLPDRHSLEKLKDQYDLNDQQAKALSAVLSTRPLSLVQGPPGTGKTVFIAALVHAALTSGLARNVLLASQAHEAVNNAAEAVLKLFARAGEVPSILRVGNEAVVSDRLLPFHVDRVEQLQKDRFRAELRERLAVAAQGLGLPEALTEALTHIELAIRPVTDRMASLHGEENSTQRIQSLRETIDRQISPLGIGELPTADIPIDEILGTMIDACLKTIPHGERPSADRIAKFQAVAALARDFMGTVSTEQRSLETFLAGTRQIVAGTCVGLGRSALGLTSTPFDLVIVDEAARCTASELAVPIQAGAWVVLVGDHKQLEPQHPESVVDEVAGRLGVSVAEVARSDFERVFDTAYGKVAGHTLRRQYRMLPPIGEIVSQSFYENRLEHGRVTPIIEVAALPADLNSPVTWIDTASFGERAKQADPNHKKSLTNAVEADVIVSLLKRWSECQPFIDWLSQQSSHTHGVGIICAYAAQRDLVRRKIASAPIHSVLRTGLKVDTIDSYQGKENPIVIMSLVRNNWDGPTQGGSKTIRPGFLAKSNRINVAISRAMDRLVIVGSSKRWAKDGPMDRIVRAFSASVKEGHAKEIDAMDLLEKGINAEPIEQKLEAAP
jgi:serine/threonine protein kinase